MFAIRSLYCFGNAIHQKIKRIKLAKLHTLDIENYEKAGRHDIETSYVFTIKYFFFLEKIFTSDIVSSLDHVSSQAFFVDIFKKEARNTQIYTFCGL